MTKEIVNIVKSLVSSNNNLKLSLSEKKIKIINFAFNITLTEKSKHIEIYISWNYGLLGMLLLKKAHNIMITLSNEIKVRLKNEGFDLIELYVHN